MVTVAVVGLGYVGLPLAVAFGEVYDTLGYDLDADKVARIARGEDLTGEVSAAEFGQAHRLEVSSDPERLRRADIVVVAVPTPVDEAHQPDFEPLITASRCVGERLKRGALVIYESTVYPGATEEICVPVLESASGLRWKQDFFVAYSPERINPGDREHRLGRIVKVVAGDTPDTLDRVADFYSAVVPAGIYRAGSIRVAEAAKVIENTQRDLNIALMNELAMICERVGIDTLEVLRAAETKWNFVPFRPGLVGGHCIGVDPYYLTRKAEQLGYYPQVILAGRRINDGMGQYVAERVVKRLIQRSQPVMGQAAIVLGLTFKENVPDLRNSKVVDVVRELASYGMRVHVHDPIADPDEVADVFGMRPTPLEDLPPAAALVVAVPHRPYLEIPLADLVSPLLPGGVFADIKSAFDRSALEAGGVSVWRL